MCSPRPQPTPPPSMTISDRNSQLNALSVKIAQEESVGNTTAASMNRYLASKIAATAVDPASAQFAPKVGNTGQQTVAPSADHIELAKEQLTGLLSKRATSTLRIPVTQAPPSTQ